MATKLLSRKSRSKCPFGGRCPESSVAPDGCELWMTHLHTMLSGPPKLTGNCVFTWIGGYFKDKLFEEDEMRKKKKKEV